LTAPAGAALFHAVLVAAVVSGVAILPQRDDDSRLEVERRAKFLHEEAPVAPAQEAPVGVVALVPTRAGVRMLAPTSARATLDQENKTFVPHLLPIVVGTTVDFPNHDEIYHNVFSYSRTKRFDLGRYGAKESRSVTFDKTGVVRVFCEIHSFMSATIVVVPTPHFSTIDAAGGFEIRGVPAGQYEVLLWHDGLSELASLRSLAVAATDSVRIRLAP
jgi:plastocyanin